MSFFFKKKKPPTQEVKEDVAVEEAFTIQDNDDDLFGEMDLDISSTPHEVESTHHQILQSNVDELKDLVLTCAKTNESGTTSSENVFAFIDQGDDTVETPEMIDDQKTTNNCQQQPTYDKTDTDDTFSTTSDTTITADKSPPQCETNDGSSSSSTPQCTEVTNISTTTNTTTTSTKTTKSNPSRQQIPKGKKKRKARLPGGEVRNTTEERHTPESFSSSNAEITKEIDGKGGLDKETLTETDKPEFRGEAIQSGDLHETVETESKETEKPAWLAETSESKALRGTVGNESKETDKLSVCQEISLSNELVETNQSNDDVETSCSNDNVETSMSNDHVETIDTLTNQPLKETIQEEEESTSDAHSQVELDKEIEVDDTSKLAEVVKNVDQADNLDDLFDDDMLTDFDNETRNEETSQDVVQNLRESSFVGSDNDIKKELSLELNEDDKFYLAVESLEMKFNALREIVEDLNRKRDEVISNWNSSKVNIDSIPEKVKELQEKQQMFAEQDDFDQAAEIEQQTRDIILQGEHFKYQHPFLNEKICGVVVAFKENLARHMEEKSTLMSAYQEILTKHEKRIKNEDKSTNEVHQEFELQLKEEQLTLDRKLSHLTLDKEHLIQNKDILDDEIKRKTSNLLIEKQTLLEKRSFTQEKIEELEKELKKYREEEQTYNEKIENMDKNINDITREFEPRLKKIELEQLENITEGENTKMKMADVERQMEEVAEKKQEMEAKIQRDQSILNNLETKSNQLKTVTLSTNMVDETFSLDEVTGLDTLINTDDAEIEEIKKKIVETETNFQKHFDKILFEKSRLKSLERMVKDLEGQLLELQKAKQVAVKERKYKDAKRLSEEIKTLTEEGEEKQREILDIEQSLKVIDNKLHSTKDELSDLQKNYDTKLKDFDYKIIKSLQQANEDIKSFLSKNPDTWFKEICDLQFLTNQEIIQKLNEKHCFNDQSDDEFQEKMSKKVLQLEQQLNEAENEEDWDLAEKLNDEIALIKTKIEVEN